MKTSRDPDVLIKAFLEDGINELPDRSFDVVRASIDNTRQWAVIGPWREHQMNALRVVLVAAAVVLLAVVGIKFLGETTGPAATPSPAPTSTAVSTTGPTIGPTVVPTVVPTPIADPQGSLAAGTYIAHPFQPPNASLSFTFTVPDGTWDTLADPGHTLGIAAAGDSQDVAMVFLNVTSLNPDACQWFGDADDLAIGPTVDDLVNALAASDNFQATEAEEVSLGGYSGKKVVLTMPADLAPGGNTQLDCDQLSYMPWNAPDGFTIYAQGPENIWQLWILDVDGQRVVVQTSQFADSDPGTLEQLDAIINSIVIAP